VHILSLSFLFSSDDIFTVSDDVSLCISQQVIPTTYAVRSGRHAPVDDYFGIRDTDLTPEQARRARYFVQPLTEMGLKAPASNT
jgi:hypothetical protein